MTMMTTKITQYRWQNKNVNKNVSDRNLFIYLLWKLYTNYKV